MRATPSCAFFVAASNFSPPTKTGEYKTIPRDAPPANPSLCSSCLELKAQCDGPVCTMAPQTRKLNKPLTCFYCNRKSTTKYDGSMRRFECNNCNATNHLDTVSNRGSYMMVLMAFQCRLTHHNPERRHHRCSCFEEHYRGPASAIRHPPRSLHDIQPSFLRQMSAEPAPVHILSGSVLSRGP